MGHGHAWTEMAVRISKHHKYTVGSEQLDVVVASAYSRLSRNVILAPGLACSLAAI